MSDQRYRNLDVQEEKRSDVLGENTGTLASPSPRTFQDQIVKFTGPISRLEKHPGRDTFTDERVQKSRTGRPVYRR